MAFDLSWLYEGRVLYARIYGAITDADDAAFDAAIQQQLTAGKGLPVHLITDYTAVDRVQTHICPEREPDMTALAKDPRLGFRVACGRQNPILRYLHPLVSFALKPCAQRVNNLNDALAYLSELDNTLPQPRALARVVQEAKLA